MLGAKRLSRKLRELRLATLQLAPDTVFYVDTRMLPKSGWRRRLVLAHLHWRGILAVPTESLRMGPEGTVVAAGYTLPLRRDEISFELYEMWLAFILSGMPLVDALEAAYAMEMLDGELR